jgi:hypothetical protein
LLPWAGGVLEALVQEFLKDDQQEFYFSDDKKGNMVVEKNSYQQKRSQGPAFETKR